MKGHEMRDEIERPVPDDPDAVDRDPYVIPEPEDGDGPYDRPRPDHEEGAQRLPGADAPDRMIVGNESTTPQS